MNTDLQRSRGEALLALHHADTPLLLANAWDVISARLFEEAGYPAIATTSAGVAWAAGYPDGERIPRDEMLAAVERIAHAVSIPVTADLEAGYARTAHDVAETTRLAISAGAVGMNLEDAMAAPPRAGVDPLYSLDFAVERVAAARSAADATGVRFVINARTDLFLKQLGDAEDRLGRAIERANAYRAAGADCLFVPGVHDAETIGALARGIQGPLNILARATTPPMAELARLGVARVSTGPGTMLAALTAAARASRDLLESGRFEPLLQSTLTFPTVNALVSSARGA
jgi:2-methylisocitrate lyase-like PEP mutase family enzyme